MSLTDGGIQPTMPVQPANNYGGGMGMWGDNWIWIIVLFLFGWGRNGNGWGGDWIGKSVEISISALNNAITGGFATTTQALNSGFQNAELSRCNQQAALMQQLNNMAMQAQECCCENRAAIAQVRYDMATQACDTRNTVQNTTRDIIDAMNCGFRSIDQRLTAQELAAKDAKIAEQNQQLFGYQLAASQAAQNNYLVSTLRPSPSPAYVVANPYCCNSGYNYGCGNCA